MHCWVSSTNNSLGGRFLCKFCSHSFRILLNTMLQISAILDIRDWQSRNDNARKDDQLLLNEHLAKNQNMLMEHMGKADNMMLAVS